LRFLSFFLQPSSINLQESNRKSNSKTELFTATSQANLPLRKFTIYQPFFRQDVPPQGLQRKARFSTFNNHFPSSFLFDHQLQGTLFFSIPSASINPNPTEQPQHRQITDEDNQAVTNRQGLVPTLGTPYHIREALGDISQNLWHPAKMGEATTENGRGVCASYELIINFPIPYRLVG